MGTEEKMEPGSPQWCAVTEQETAATTWNTGNFDIWEKDFFDVRVIKQCHRLLREAVQSPSLKILKWWDVIQENVLYLTEQGRWYLEAPPNLGGFVTH